MNVDARALALLAALSTGCAYSGTVGDYSVGGTVSGLSTDSGVLLTDAAGSGVFVSGNGRFSIDNAFADGAVYDLAVNTDPRTPSVRCSVRNGKGVIEASDVDNVTITCAQTAFELGGTVSGLDGIGLILSARGAEIAVGSDGTFVFPGKITNGSKYDVTIAQQPEGQTCTLENGSGTVTDADVSVVVTCQTN